MKTLIEDLKKVMGSDIENKDKYMEMLINGFLREKQTEQLTLTDVSQGTELLFCKCGSVKNGGYGCMRTDCDNTLQAFMQNNCG